MTPRRLFDDLWSRADELALLYDSLVGLGIPQSRADELLRAEWVARVAALDLFVHELVATRMVQQFSGRLPLTDSYKSFRLSTETLRRVREAPSFTDAAAAFDLDVRAQLGLITYQSPDKISEGIRLTSDVKLWLEVAKKLNPTAPAADWDRLAKGVKRTLSLMVERRNKIAHEGDLGPSIPREPYAISVGQLADVREFIRNLVNAIDEVVAAADPPAAP